MREVIFHIGVHEAMTTALQGQLYQARHALRAAGLRYPSLGRYNAHHWMPGAWVALPRGLERRDPEGTLRRMLAHLPEGQSVMLSSQEFWRAAPNPVDFAALAAMVPADMRRRVVVVVRDQASLVPALWYAMGRGRDPGQWHDRIKEVLTTGCLDGLDLDYSALWQRLRAGFAAQDITVIDHHSLTSAVHGPASEVLSALGHTEAAASAAPFFQPEKAVHQALHWARHVAQMVSAPAASGPGLVRACRRIAEHYAPGERLQLLTRQEHDAMLARFGPGNEALRAAAPDAPDLNQQMAERLQTGVFREELGPDFWIDLCMRIHVERDQKGQGH